MLTLPTNLPNYIGRLFSIAIIFIIGYLLINFGLKQSSNGNIIYLLYFILIILSYLAFTIIYSLLCINEVQINTNNDSITFVGLISKQTILCVDISEYFETYHKNPFKQWNGILIKTFDNKTIQVTGQNIKLLSNFKKYLDERKIFNSGQKKMKYPFN